MTQATAQVLNYPSTHPDVGAAPHLPAGILSPYRDGERGAVVTDFANRQGYRRGAGVAASPLLPVPTRGEVPGRAMRGSATPRI
ncbi:hypothetical protein FKO01_14010 [Mesorhizobium sp. B2-3-3]|nr:hypothetical protein FJ958_04895 [Mesorhizobium sp. B2-3-5]TPN32704.1 hypothetical protein FKO01_14010 [Mesorhizobium sp. B2-3-3]